MQYQAVAHSPHRTFAIVLCALLGALALTSRARAQAPADLCIGDGGTAECTGPDVGPYSYIHGSVTWPGAGKVSSDQIGLDALLDYAFTTIHACSANLENPEWLGPPPALGYGSRAVGDVSSVQQDTGDYITQSWYLSVETQQSKQTLRVKGIRAPDVLPACGYTFWSGTLGDTRQRSVSCPEGFQENFTPPIWRYCYRPGTPGVVDKPKNLGKCKDCELLVGHPTNVATGNKFLEEADYRGAGPFPLEYTRSYNSLGPGSSAGPDFLDNVPKWRGTYDRAVRFNEHPSFPGATIYRPDGRVLRFKLLNGVFVADADVNERLSRTVDGSGNTVSWTLITERDETETYDAAGQLAEISSRAGIKHTIARDTAGRIQTVTHSFGQQLTFAYDAQNRALTITLPGGGQITYAYNSHNDITSVTYPDGRVRQYAYNTTAELGLTGIIDENNAQFATYTYSSGRVASSQLAGGADAYTFTYTSGTRTTVVDALGQSRTYDFEGVLGTAHATATSAFCIACRGSSKTKTSDANGNVATRTNFNDVATHYAYDLARNLETSRTEAYGTSAARTITTQWHSIFRLPTLITEPGRTTGFTYDSAGNVLTRTVTDTSVTPNATRTWTYTYNSYGQILTEDGPRADVSDVTTYTYYSCSTGYQCGQLHTVSDALGHVTTFNTYNVHGQPLTITDQNSVVTVLTYDTRQRLTSRQVGSETTTFTYWPTGLLKKVTLPDSSFLLYTYDDAHRLTKIEDGEGNHLDYTLDAAGNRTAESAYDPSSVLASTRTRVFNNLSRLWKEIGAAGTFAVTTSFGYDGQGNQISIAAPLGRNSANQYDELGRLEQVTDPGTGVTQFAYDTQDNLTQVTDPRGKVTTYAYSGFGDLTQLASPDTGTTGSTYDAAGNLSTRTDARSKTGTYSYDALNRVTSIAYPDLTTAFTYDSGTNGVGRLTGASDANHSLSFTYDAQGRVTGKTQTVGSVTKSVSYGYTNGDLTSVVTPSGQTIAYGYTEGRISSITLNGATTILNQVLYESFGPISGWTWGNSSIAARIYDQDYRVTQLDSAGLRTYTYDDASRITAIEDADTPALSATYAYDSMDRLLPPGYSPPNTTLGVALSGTNVAAGASVTATLSNIPAGSGYWVVLAPVGAPLTTYTAATAVSSSGAGFVWNMTMPQYAGSYEVRLFQGNFVSLLTSSPITVAAPSAPSQPTLNLSVGSAAPGASVTVRLAGAPGGSTDWLALAVSGSGNTSYLQWVYVGTGVTSRDWTVTMPATAGDYVFRFFLNDGYVLTAASSVVHIASQALTGGTVVGGSTPTNLPYDLNGNRLFDDASTYTISSTSNRLVSVNGGINRTYSYDAAGNTTNDGNNTYTYNDSGRLRTVTRAGLTTTYIYNALGQRVKKSNSTLTRYFVYDEAGHLLGEYDGTGALVQETVWLNDIPVATLRPNGASVSLYYIHTDHLNTPRRISRPSDNVIVWRWDSDAFGTTAANEDSDGDTNALAFNLRFPGQYADAESGMYYNYRRNYDPYTGRYVESDPIGLKGGVNTYAYVGGNPVMGVDPFGLFTSDQHAAMTYEVLANDSDMLPCLREALAGVIGLDFATGSQSIPSAYLHSMAQPEQSATAAAKQSNDYINSEIRKCNCTALGYALHTAQDSAAWGHQYKTYNGPESMWSIGGLIHLIADYWPSGDRRTEAIMKSRNVVAEYKAHCSSCAK